MDNETDVGAAAARLAEHARTLREGAAPHQQGLADDLTALASHVAGGTVSRRRHEELQQAERLAQDQLRTLRQNVDKTLDDRDLAKKALEELKREHERELEAARQDKAEALKSAENEIKAIEQKRAALEAAH